MRARKPKVVKENSERWLLTYSDLITLLMIFFVLLYAMSSTDSRKFQDLTGALQQAFNNGTYQLVTIGGSPGNPHTLSGTLPGKKALLKQIKQQVAKMLRMVGMPQSVVTVGDSHEGIVLSFGGNVLFYPGDTKLKPDSLPLLGRMATILRTLPNQIRVEGNTDDQKAGTNGSTSNWTLSVLRAVSIVEYLAGPGGVPPSHLQAEGLGQYHPVATNSTPQGRARNRHADVVVLYGT
jgi:chemotaxis protein MotB